MTSERPAHPSGGRLELDAEARRRFVGTAAVGVSVALLLGLGTLLYSGDELLTVGGLAILALLCEGAESLDEWIVRSGKPTDTAVASRAMRFVVLALVVYMTIIGIQDAVTASSGDALAAGLLITGGGALTLAVIAVGTWRVPGARGLRPRVPISWFALAVSLQALAQNLAPATASAGVATTIAKPASAADLITGSLPYGAVALLAVGPGVRRGVVPWLRRLGVLPLRSLALPGGVLAGLLLLPLLDATFGASEATPSEVARHMGPLAVVVAVAAVVPGVRREVLAALRPTPDSTPSSADRVLRGCLLLLVVLCAVDAAGLVISVTVAHLPADCLAQQAEVGQSLSGGPTGRSPLANLGIALAAGVDEELLFRGVLQPRIGLVGSSVVFASFHLQYTCHGLPSAGNLEIVVLGLLFGLLRQRLGLPAAILAHAAYDASILLGWSL